MTGHEIELKLGLSPEDLAKLPDHSCLAPFMTAPAVTKLLDSTYFDTPDFALAAAGLSLRVRQTGSGLVQTVKTAGSTASGLFCRGEWEAGVKTLAPDSAHLLATGLPLLAEDGVVGALVPVFSTRFRRTVLRLAESGSWEVEAALDLGEVVAGPHAAAISELELELVSGRPEHLFMLARRVADSIAARPLPLTKSDRGYRLAAGRAEQPVKGKPPRLSQDMTVAEAFQTIARSCLDHLLINERCLLATRDGEAIHQMRVALRRFRSALKIFRPVVRDARLAELKGEMSWLLSSLGPARDAEVFITEILDPVAAAHPDHDGLAALRAYWRADRDYRTAAALDAVRDRRFTSLVLALGEWVEAGPWLGTPATPRFKRLDSPIQPFATARMGKAARKLLSAAGDHLDRLGHEDLHQVRILGKQVRYAGEFFASLVPRKQMKVYLAELSDLQGLLGQLNDIAVANPKLTGRHLEGGRARAAGLVAGWHQSRRATLLKEAEKSWKRWRAMPLPWEE